MAKKTGKKIRRRKKRDITEKTKKRTGMCYTAEDIVVVDGFGHENRTSSSTDESMEMNELRKEANDLNEQFRALHADNIKIGRELIALKFQLPPSISNPLLRLSNHPRQLVLLRQILTKACQTQTKERRQA
jgi:hypothetical protein